MTRSNLLRRLKALAKRDAEEAHVEADAALIEYVNDEDIAKAYAAIPKWYA